MRRRQNIGKTLSLTPTLLVDNSTKSNHSWFNEYPSGFYIKDGEHYIENFFVRLATGTPDRNKGKRKLPRFISGAWPGSIQAGGKLRVFLTSRRDNCRYSLRVSNGQIQPQKCTLTAWLQQLSHYHSHEHDCTCRVSLIPKNPIEKIALS
ncbi:hypothetical protein O9993_12185 [Vibrio lentus]|nr:hypothetical protein [Vibrio lentus]